MSDDTRTPREITQSDVLEYMKTVADPASRDGSFSTACAIKLARPFGARTALGIPMEKCVGGRLPFPRVKGRDASKEWPHDFSPRIETGFVVVADRDCRNDDDFDPRLAERLARKASRMIDAMMCGVDPASLVDDDPIEVDAERVERSEPSCEGAANGHSSTVSRETV